MPEVAAFARQARLLPAARWVVGVVALVSGVAAAVEMPVGGFVEVRMRTFADSTAEIFFDAGRGFNELDSSALEIRKRDGVATYRFPLRSARVLTLRFDPLRVNGRVELFDLVVTDRAGLPLRRIDLSRLTSIAQVDILRPAGRGIEIVTSESAVDPSVRVPIDPAPTLLRADAIVGVTEPVKRVFRAIYRRVPGSAALPLLAPWLLLLWVWMTLLLRLGKPPAVTPDGWSRSRTAAAASYVVLFLALHAYLIAETYRWYYGT